MSVINRMLRDLDQRQHNPGGSSYTPAASAPQPLHWAWLLAVALGTATLIIVALLIWWWINTTAVSADTARTMPAVEPVQQLAEQTITVREDQDGQQQNTEQPAAENRSAGDLSAAEVSRATPEPEAPVVAELSEQSADDSETETEPASAEIKSESKPKPESESKPEPEQTDASLSSFEKKSVQLTPRELAENNLEKARVALRKGEREKAQGLLEKALIVMPDHVAVRSELAAYWFGRGQVTRAIALLRNGLERQPMQSQWQLLHARILEQTGNIEDVYGSLRSIDPDAEEFPELLQLRAMAANQLGYFDQAAADYAALAVEQPRGRWWLAAAAAFEDAGNIPAAIRSYQQAVESADLAREGRSYAQQRLQALGGQ
ncbi:hypothetical protein IDSA_00085 [Pseudidiomarina salinarum]|uniref:Uncharacterized protein n=1 Tax=Pseudidiomarina salinarum TaxID=435908 RepID=A0A094L8L9_9GAMM|nr:tetratricopeptide repeat protein [Pseudidiomarina salinarum]KFZ31173.1 hypothetical protein IDSA_00085 [Pseudidiomarina salinarum]RUO71079.1 hypothetical protein CWI79_06485 [Pseudidiomarina salinarum]